jgi:hypothetical protein
MFESNRQSDSPRTSWAGKTLAFAAILALSAAAWWAWPGTGDDHDFPAQPSNASSTPKPAETSSAVRENGSPANFPNDVPGAKPARITATPPEASPRELEQRFLGTQEKDAQIDVVAEIAGHNNADAVQTLARVFRQARDPVVKETILSRLADIDPEVAPFERIDLLQGALFAQPRNVRLTALDVLAQSEDPRALLAVRRAAREDPDKLIREAAAAIAEAVGAKEQ